MATTTTPKRASKAEIAQLEAEFTPEKSRELLKTDIANLRQSGLPEECIERYRDILVRRGNYGGFTRVDAEFLLALRSAGTNPEALTKVCKESPNTWTGALIGCSIVFGTIATLGAILTTQRTPRIA